MSLYALHSLALVFTIITVWAKATPAKPVCDPMEPCKVGFLGLEFCACSNGTKCPKNPETTVVYENIKYHFCEAPTLHTCVEDELAWTRRGLRQTIHCKCPAPFKLTSEVWDTKTDTTKYTCSKRRTCQRGDTCMVRNRVFIGKKTLTLLKGLCQCPRSQQCAETGFTVKSRLVELQQDIFKCVTEVDEGNEEYGNEEEDRNDGLETGGLDVTK